MYVEKNVRRLGTIRANGALKGSDESDNCRYLPGLYQALSLGTYVIEHAGFWQCDPHVQWPVGSIP